MGLTHLLDTSTLSLLVREHAGVVEQVTRHAEGLALASVVAHELLFGVERLDDGRKKRLLRARINDVLRLWRVLPYGRRAARWHARERARLVRQGRAPTGYDALIAAVAAVNRLTLVTENVRDFEPFNELRIESWG